MAESIYICPKCGHHKWYVSHRRKDGSLWRVRCKKCKKTYTPEGLSRQKKAIRPPTCPALVDAGKKWKVCGLPTRWWSRNAKGQRMAKCKLGHCRPVGEDAERHLEREQARQDKENS